MLLLNETHGGSIFNILQWSSFHEPWENWNHGLSFYTSLNLGHMSGKSNLFLFFASMFPFFFPPNKSNEEGVGFPAAEYCVVSSNAASTLQAGFTASLISQHQ